MTNRAHQKAFSLLLISRDRLLEPSERSFLEGHLSTCDTCNAQIKVHQILQNSIRFAPRGPGLQKQGFRTKLPEFLNLLDQKRVVRKTKNIVLSFSRLGVAVVLIAALLWVLNRNYPKLLPAISTQATYTPLISLDTTQSVTNSPPSTRKVTPTEAVSKPRTEVIIHTVQQNDTIFRIAEEYELKPETILWSNSETLSGVTIILKPGMELNILPVDGVYYKWKDGDDLNAVASRMGVQPEDIIDWPGNHLYLETSGDPSHPNIVAGTMLVIPGGKLYFVDWNVPNYP